MNAAVPAGVSSRLTASRSVALVRTLALTFIGVGAFLRVHAFKFPDAFLFDEHHFVLNARNYLVHRVDQNDHPPLGKLIIAASIQIFGDNPIGWRTPALVLGALTLALGALTAARLFQTRVAALLTAAVFSADGFMIAYSRAALLDGYLTTCAIASLLLASFPASTGTALLGGLLAGVASNLKFSGIGVFIPLLVSAALSTKSWPRRALFAALLGASASITYVALYAYGLSYTREAVGASDVWNDTLRLVQHHAVLTQMENPWTSGWSTWVLPVRPLLLGFSQQDGTVRALTTLGNLAFWWSSFALAFASGWVIVTRGLHALLGSAEPNTGTSLAPSAYVATHARAVVLVLSCALAFLAPWVLTHRDSYIYHFLPSYACMLMLLAGYLAWALPRQPNRVLQFLLLASIVLVVYAPLWSFMPISIHDFKLRLFLKSWR